jgi:hypothetical protein
MNWLVKLFKPESSRLECLRVLDETEVMVNKIQVSLHNSEKQNEILFANLKGTMPEVPSVYTKAFKK